MVQTLRSSQLGQEMSATASTDATTVSRERSRTDRKAVRKRQQGRTRMGNLRGRRLDDDAARHPVGGKPWMARSVASAAGMCQWGRGLVGGSGVPGNAWGTGGGHANKGDG